MGKVPVRLDYGGGVSTIVGRGSVAIPGALAAVDKAWRRFGSLPWGELFRPTIEVVRSGFPLPAACRYYLGYSGSVIFGRSEDGYGALHDENGRVRNVRERIVVPHLADTLERIADEGAALFYTGALAEDEQDMRDA
mgnify:CR=1 FL=1